MESHAPKADDRDMQALLDALPEPWVLLVIVGVGGVVGVLIVTASALRQGIALIELEQRVALLRHQQRRQLIERGLLAEDGGPPIVGGEDDSVDVEIIEPDATAGPAPDVASKAA